MSSSASKVARPFTIACVVLSAIGLPPDSLSAQETSQQTGRIAGQVLDRTTGRAVANAQIQVLETEIVLRTDLDGRYRTPAIPAGIFSVQAFRIGYQPLRIDSVLVNANETASADFAITPFTVQVEGVQVTARSIDRPQTDIVLLQLQKVAPVVSDGISAEAISRTPDSNAGDAVQRVTGISVVDEKFVVIRGLPERYNSTLLNGTELVSPEPTRRIVPLDIFPAGLLESIVASKSATPDRPGDFAGGSVQIRTKEFPEEFVFEVDLSGGYRTLTTFEKVPLIPRGGTDFLGIDDGRRAIPENPPEVGDGVAIMEPFAEGLRSVWTPHPRTALPNYGVGMDLGGSVGETGRLGYIFSLKYDSKSTHTPNRLFQFFTSPEEKDAEFGLRFQETTSTVDWGGIANFSFRPSSASKIGFKNLYTRSASESVYFGAGFEEEEDRNIRTYQVKYVETELLQSQLAGDLRVFPLSISWKLTRAHARRYEPDNRQASYLREDAGLYMLTDNVPTRAWNRDLSDLLYAAQLDLAVPFRLWNPSPAELKVGGLRRVKDRDFEALQFNIMPDPTGDDPNLSVADTLPPEMAYTPEFLGTTFQLQRSIDLAQSYAADDDVTAGYGMLDLPLTSWLRIVGGVRYEDWSLNLFRGLEGRDIDTTVTPLITRRIGEWLPSANVTVRLSEWSNLRLSGFRSVSRPDAREISSDVYLSVNGRCSRQGYNDLEHTNILNGDVRLEFFPGSGELISFSGFYKEFDRPIVETIKQVSTNACREVYRNATSATTFGGEFEIRKSLWFLPGVLSDLAVAGNVMLVRSRVTIPEDVGTYDPDLPLAGQSPYLINGTLGYLHPTGSFSASVLINYFHDRVIRYGQSIVDAGQLPNLYEKGRIMLDAKVQAKIGTHFTFSIAGQNLTDRHSILYHPAGALQVLAEQYKLGIKLKVGFGYAY